MRQTGMPLKPWIALHIRSASKINKLLFWCPIAHSNVRQDKDCSNSKLLRDVRDGTHAFLFA